MFDASELARISSFVRESNAIEGIFRDPTDHELEATADFVGLDQLDTDSLCRLQAVYAPGKPLRDRPGLNVRVGRHIAPPGGSNVVSALITLLYRANAGVDPWRIHVDYENLHPFCDGNGRTGRAIWLWQMKQTSGRIYGCFLHEWYYQTLQHCGSTR